MNYPMNYLGEFLAQWSATRAGVLAEAERIPADKFDFRATTATRSVREVLQHIVESERALTAELCRDDTDLRRVFAPYAKDAKVQAATTKEALLALLRSSLAECQVLLRQAGAEKFTQTITGLDGQPVSKRAMLEFTVSHEMYHRGQLTVYERMLGIEPALTEQFRRLVNP